MRRVRFILVPGWGLDAGFWAPLRSELADVPSTVVLPRALQAASEVATADGEALVAVGHSFGLLALLHHRPFRWEALVSFNGFTRFTQGPDFAEGVSPRVLERMRRRFASDPTTVLADFLRRCGAPADGIADFALASDHELLAAELHAMATWDERARRGKPRLALASRNDPIVPPALTVASHGEAVVWHETGGHLLPWTEPAWCARHLLRLAEQLA